MKCFFACLKKDLRLFFSNTVGAALSLLLPVAVFALLLSGGAELMQASARIEPFSVAVRDEDQTFMSRTLVQQLSTVALFDAIVDAGPVSDADLFQNGAAAVITLPKDFFYDAYDMQANVGLAMNPAMPVEASIVRELAVTVLDVVAQNQIAVQVNRTLNGQDAASDETKAEAARAIFRDAFALLDMMQMDAMQDSAMDSMAVMLLACVLSLFCMLIPLQVTATLCEDLVLGVLPRYTAAGGSVTALVLSKLVTSLVLTGLPVLAMLLGLGSKQLGALLTLACVQCVAAFGMSLLLSAAVRRSEGCLLFGNLYILISVLLGGVIYPLSLMPDAVVSLRYLMLPYHVLCGVKSVSSHGLLPWVQLLPVLAAGVVCLLLGTVLFQGRRRLT